MSDTKRPVVSDLIVRNAIDADVAQITDLSERAYAKSGMKGYAEGMVKGQINQYPKGQFVLESDGQIIGYCATFRISGALALAPHTWVGITGNGYASRHDPDGEYLYGMEVCVDPAYRGYRMGQRLYDARKKLCLTERLQGIIFAGRLPALSRRLKKFGTPEAYIEAVKKKAVRDPVLSFQLKNGFEILGLMPKYLETDHHSLWLWRTHDLAQSKNPDGS